jgi:hypothetical protein
VRRGWRFLRVRGEGLVVLGCLLALDLALHLAAQRARSGVAMEYALLAWFCLGQFEARAGVYGVCCELESSRNGERIE